MFNGNNLDTKITLDTSTILSSVTIENDLTHDTLIENMDASIKSTFISYSREELIKIRTSIYSSKDSVVPFGISNKRPRCNKKDMFKLHEREGDGIILGPQKRTWNVGCHVTLSKKLPQDTVSNQYQNKHSKPMQDRNIFSKISDVKRDVYTSDRSYNKQSKNKDNLRSSTSIYSKSHGQLKFDSSRNFDKCKHSSEEREPEWFSEGPVNINETIELGDLIDDHIDENELGFSPICSNKNKSDSSDVENLKDSVVSSVECNIEPVIKEPNSTVSSDFQFLMTSTTSKPESGGSRFCHLFKKFGKNGVNCEAVKSNINRINETAPVEYVQSHHISESNARELETALRALLLGKHDNQILEKANESNISASLPGCRVRTLEEIEAGLLYSKQNQKSTDSNILSMFANKNMSLSTSTDSWNCKKQFASNYTGEVLSKKENFINTDLNRIIQNMAVDWRNIKINADHRDISNSANQQISEPLNLMCSSWGTGSSNALTETPRAESLNGMQNRINHVDKLIVENPFNNPHTSLNIPYFSRFHDSELPSACRSIVGNVQHIHDSTNRSATTHSTHQNSHFQVIRDIEQSLEWQIKNRVAVQANVSVHSPYSSSNLQSFPGLQSNYPSSILVPRISSGNSLIQSSSISRFGGPTNSEAFNVPSFFDDRSVRRQPDNLMRLQLPWQHFSSHNTVEPNVSSIFNLLDANFSTKNFVHGSSKNT